MNLKRFTQILPPRDSLSAAFPPCKRDKGLVAPIESRAGSVLTSQPTRHAVVLAAYEQATGLDAEKDEVPCQFPRVPDLAVVGFQFVPLVGDEFGFDWLAAVGTGGHG